MDVQNRSWADILKTMTTEAIGEWIDSATVRLDMLAVELSDLGYSDDYQAYDDCRTELQTLNAMVISAVREHVGRDL